MTRLDALVEEQQSARLRLLRTIADLRYLCDRAAATVVSGRVLSSDALRVKAIAVDEAARMWDAATVAVASAIPSGGRR